jgi:hypothetical protein
MEREERELIERALSTNFEVKKLYDQHLRFEERLQTLGKKVYLTPPEETEQRKLKLLKLMGVEKMIKLASSLREVA